jgi:hypothetical protein
MRGVSIQEDKYRMTAESRAFRQNAALMIEGAKR